MRKRREPQLVSESLAQGVALVCLLVMAGFAVAGPSGVLAWGENQRLLEEHRVEIASLTEQKARLRNRVHLLTPDRIDADLAGQLLRSHLNVAHPDEMVMLLE